MFLLLRHIVWGSEALWGIWAGRPFLILPLEHLSLFKTLCGTEFMLFSNILLLFGLVILKTPNGLFFGMFLHHESFSCSFSKHSASHIYFFPLKRVYCGKGPLLQAGAACLLFSFIVETGTTPCCLCAGGGTPFNSEGWTMFIKTEQKHDFTPV